MKADAEKLVGLEQSGAKPYCHASYPRRLAQRTCDLQFKIGSAFVHGYLYFYNDELSEVLILFGSISWDEVSGGFIEKYGPPGSRVRPAVQNRLGASFQNDILSWSGKTINVTAAKYLDTLDDSYVVIQTNFYRDSETNFEAEKKKKAAEAF